MPNKKKKSWWTAYSDHLEARMERKGVTFAKAVEDIMKKEFAGAGPPNGCCLECADSNCGMFCTRWHESKQDGLNKKGCFECGVDDCFTPPERKEKPVEPFFTYEELPPGHMLEYGKNYYVTCQEGHRRWKGICAHPYSDYGYQIFRRVYREEPPKGAEDEDT